MKQILIVAATAAELAPTFKKYQINFNASVALYSSQLKNTKVNFLITGVGMVNTAFQLGKISNIKFDVIINAGIAGTFDSNMPLGQVVLVMQDELAEMGAEDGDDFILFNDLNLGGSSIFTAKYDDEIKAINHLPKVNGITVNKVHGKIKSIEKTKQFFNADVESMEGAAFYRATENMAPIVIQIRSISNLIEKRDKSKWQIPLAIKNVNACLINIIESIES